MAGAEDPATARSSRVEALLQQLRTEEMVALLSGRGMWTAGGVPRLGLPPLALTDGPMGMRGLSTSGDPGSTLAPCELAMAATFDEELITELGELLGAECRRRGGHVLLGPCLNLQRTPLFGRHFECFSEDPFLSARAGVAYVRGVQRHVAACAKHLVCNDQEDGRHTMNSVIDERTLHEVYLAPFEAAVVEGHVESVMCGYNRLNGYFCAENRWLLEKVLRKDWGFRGWVISDWFGNQSTVPAITAGLNIEMPGIEPRHFGGYLLDAVRRDEVSEDLLRERCRPVLDTLLRHAAVPGHGDDGPREAPVESPARAELLRRVAASSFVLLKNEGPALPLEMAGLRRILVTGPFAACTTVQGGGSCRVSPRDCPSVLEALRAALLPAGVEVLHEPGCRGSEFQHTTAEAEALKVLARCDASGRFHGLKFFPLVTDAFLALAAAVSQKECFRVFWMPVLRPLGLRQADPRNATPESHSRQQRRNLLVGIVAVIAVLMGLLAKLGAANFRFLIYAISAGLAAIWFLCASVGRAREERSIRAAEAAAVAADACVLVLGTDGFWESEGMDQPHMRLPGRQNELAARIAAAARGPVIAVLNVGSPKELPWIDQVPAVLLTHFAGEQMGPAVADALFGRVCPSGRLPTTWPRRLEDAPASIAATSSAAQNAAAQGETLYAERCCIGHRHFSDSSSTVQPLFHFGHGLSFSSFGYGELQVALQLGRDTSAGPTATATISVRNTGSVAAREVAQLYVRTPGSPRSLCGFARTGELPTGAEQKLCFQLGPRALGGFYDAEAGCWKPPAPGTVATVEVGASSADIRARAELHVE